MMKPNRFDAGLIRYGTQGSLWRDGKARQLKSKAGGTWVEDESENDRSDF